jgi:CheY-like chemotaxis protein
MNVDSVLIADEDLESIAIVKEALLQNRIDAILCLGDTIYESHDGLDSLNVIAEKNVNVIISEIDMPNLPADNLIEFLIDNQIIDDAIILFLTKANNPKELTPLMKQYAVGLLSKPFSTKQLVASFTDLMMEQVQKAEITQRVNMKRDAECGLTFNILERLINKVSPARS